MPRIMIAIPAKRLMFHNCLSLNFFLNRLTKVLNRNHHDEAPRKTPSNMAEMINEPELLSTLVPKKAKTPMIRNRHPGLVIDMRNPVR